MKTLSRILWAVGLLCLGTGIAFAQGVVTSRPVAAIDNIPPAPVTNLQALEVSDEGGKNIAVTWTLSADDGISFVSFGEGFVPRGDVRGYRVYRQVDGGEPILIATVSAGTSRYVDQKVEAGKVYTYAVHPFDLDNETLFLPVLGSPEDLARTVVVSGLIVEPTVKAKIALGTSLDATDPEAVAAFTSRFVARLAELLAIAPTRIQVTGVTGSALVEFGFAEPAAGSPEPTAAAVLASLKTLSQSNINLFGDLGPILSLIDASSAEEVVLLLQPLTAEGTPILGWFTREGNAVDFDDFFLFADHFNLRRGDPDFDPLFDIAPNGIIDFDDFFLFADDFGKVVANADAVRAHLGL